MPSQHCSAAKARVFDHLSTRQNLQASYPCFQRTPGALRILNFLNKAMIAIAKLGLISATCDGGRVHNRLWDNVKPSCRGPICCVYLTDSMTWFWLPGPLAGQNGVVAPLPAIDLE